MYCNFVEQGDGSETHHDQFGRHSQHSLIEQIKEIACSNII